MCGNADEVEKMGGKVEQKGFLVKKEERRGGERGTIGFLVDERIRQEDGKQRMCTRTNGNRNTVSEFNKNAAKYLGEELQGQTEPGEPFHYDATFR